MSDHESLTPLGFDPFEGDFGSQGDRTLKDKMVTARVHQNCFHCNQTIVPGERHRSRVDLADGTFMKFRWCAGCCAAMILEMTGDDSETQFPFERRHALYAARR